MSDIKKRERLEAFKFAKKNSELSGFYTDAEYDAQMMRWVNGEITWEQFEEYVNKSSDEIHSKIATEPNPNQKGYYSSERKKLQGYRLSGDLENMTDEEMRKKMTEKITLNGQY